MLWALLIILLIRILSGGPQEIFLIPKLEKQIKTYVSDKDRREKLLDITKEAKKEIKAFNKFRKKSLKELRKKSIDKSFSNDELRDLFYDYYNERLKLQTSLIDKRLLSQELYSEDEWNEIIKKAVFPSEKAQKKINKGEAKEEEEIDKTFTKINKSVIKNVTDTDKQQTLMDQIEKFNKTIVEFVTVSQDLNYADSDIARNQQVSKEDLENFYKQQNELRIKGAEDYFELRSVVIENTTDKEWKAIISELNKIFK